MDFQSYLDLLIHLCLLNSLFDKAIAHFLAITLSIFCLLSPEITLACDFFGCVITPLLILS